MEKEFSSARILSVDRLNEILFSNDVESVFDIVGLVSYNEKYIENISKNIDEYNQLCSDIIEIRKPYFNTDIFDAMKNMNKEFKDIGVSMQEFANVMQQFGSIMRQLPIPEPTKRSSGGRRVTI